MIVRPEVSGTVYRATALRYFGTAFGGKGSRLGKGRFDRPGVIALYVAMDMETAYAEFQGGRPDLRPCALMSASIRIRNVLDLTVDLSACSTDIQQWNCDWEAASTAYALDPYSPAADCASWRCGDIVIEKKLAGIYFPSTKRVGGMNLAAFIEDATVGHCRVDPHDPDDEIGRARAAPA